MIYGSTHGRCSAKWVRGVAAGPSSRLESVASPRKWLQCWSRYGYGARSTASRIGAPILKLGKEAHDRGSNESAYRFHQAWLIARNAFLGCDRAGTDRKHRRTSNRDRANSDQCPYMMRKLRHPKVTHATSMPGGNCAIDDYLYSADPVSKAGELNSRLKFRCSRRAMSRSETPSAFAGRSVRANLGESNSLIFELRHSIAARRRNLVAANQACSTHLKLQS
jgi:hypothetical protein